MQLALQPLPAEENTNLEHLLTFATLTPDEKQFKDKVLDYLEAYNTEAETLNKYNEYLAEASQKLEKEISTKDESLENSYVIAVGRVNSHPLNGKTEAEVTDKTAYKSYSRLVERSNNSRDQLIRHRWMMKEISALAKTATTEIQKNQYAADFSKQEIEEVFKLIKDKKPTTEIVEALELKMIPFYHDLAIKNAMTEELDLKHIQK